MGEVVIINSASIFLELLAFASFCIGFALKGLASALLGQFIFQPIARQIKAKADKWQHTHPNVLKWALHYLDNHKGLHPYRGKCHCPSRSTAI